MVYAEAVQSNPPWGLDRIDQEDFPLNTMYNYEYDGTGVDVYIGDTGARSTHNDFGGRVECFYDYFYDAQGGSNGERCWDGHGHGKFVV